jgi:hypothetical protein
MRRRLPKSFFWIDQNIIRSGAWQRLSASSRLAYVALAASCDRDGISIWSASKLMELSACREREEWTANITELENQQLIEKVPESSPPAIRLRELEIQAGRDSTTDVCIAPKPVPGSSTSAAPIIVHTHTTIHLGGKTAHVESGNAD